jgi:protocatechuate 3,4-dioxygenase beta subunit
MRSIDEFTITDATLDQMSTATNPRFKQIMEAAVRHLHDFAREVDLTPEEWLAGISFLTAVGQTCTQYRQEFILLSDTLGLSALVNYMHDGRMIEPGTQSSLLGPFYRQDAPHFNLGDCIGKKPGSQEIGIYGQITDSEGRGIPHASIQIWQTDDEGEYDLQHNDPSQMDFRGILEADSEGRFHIRTVRPLGYLIPLDGPVGDMIRAQRRHGFRPAHIHFLIGAPGYREVVTALYVNPDDHMDSDVVFGSTASLVVETHTDDPNSPFPNLPTIHFDFSLARAAEEDKSGRVGADPAQILAKMH